jgi:hypothetical protein
VLLLACSGAPAQVAVPAGPQWTDEQIEQMIFQPYGGAAGARGRLDALLALYVEDLDRACQLTEAQKKKVDLAGRGDIKRFFDRCESVKQKCLGLVRVDPQGQAVWQEISPLQRTLQAGLFSQDSLFYRSLPHTLTPDQSLHYAAAAREREEYHHRATVELAVLSLGQQLVLREAQRQELVRLLLKETKPPRKSGIYDYYHLVFQLPRLPEEKWNALLDAPQRKILGLQLAQFRQLELSYRQAGVLEALPDDNDKADARPATPAEPEGGK